MNGYATAMTSARQNRAKYVSEDTKLQVLAVVTQAESVGIVAADVADAIGRSHGVAACALLAMKRDGRVIRQKIGGPTQNKVLWFAPQFAAAFRVAHERELLAKRTELQYRYRQAKRGIVPQSHAVWEPVQVWATEWQPLQVTGPRSVWELA